MSKYIYMVTAEADSQEEADNEVDEACADYDLAWKRY